MANTTDVDIVVARYSEDVDWLGDLAHHCIIYNKWHPATLEDEYKYKRVVQLPNVGRESHTYLYHIVENYDNLAPVTVFTQARIEDHFEGQWTPQNGCEFLWSLGKQAALYGQSQNAQMYSQLGGMSAIPLFNLRAYYARGLQKTAYDNLGQWFTALTGHDIPCQGVPWYKNALFAVKRDRIHQHPRSFYETLMQEVNNAVNPEAGHYFERTWYMIFSTRTGRII